MIRADSPTTAWVVEQGAVELFLVDPDGARTPLVEVPQGELFLGCPSRDGYSLVAVETLGTRLREVPASDEPRVEGHKQRLARAVALPEPFPKDLEVFADRAMQAAVRKARQDRDQEAETLKARYQFEVRSVEDAVQQLAAVVAGRSGTRLALGHGAPALEALLRTCEVLGERSGITFRRPAQSSRSGRTDLVTQVAHASRVFVRQVRLDGDWWRHEGGPLLAFTKEERHPVALLPVSPTRYRMVDLVQDREVPVTAAVAATLEIPAYQFYRPLPERPLRWGEMVQYCREAARPEVMRVSFMGLLAGLLSLATPVATTFLVGTAIPHGLDAQVRNTGIVLLATTLGVAVYEFARTVGLLRLEGRVDAELQAAVMGRVLMLRPDFFRRFTSGDLGQRVLGLNQIREALTGSNMQSFTGAIFSIFSFALMYYYDPALAAVGTLLTLGMFGLLVWTGALFVGRAQRIADMEGVLSGRVLQLLKGISKIRVAGAEGRAFGTWASVYARQRGLMLSNRMIEAAMSAVRAVFPIVTSLCFFAVAASQGYTKTTSASFLGFFAAFGQFQAAVLGMAGALSGVLRVVPLIRRYRPLVTAEVEVGENRPDPGVLEGHVKLDGVSFRYQQEGALVLHEVTLEAKPGEFIAVVGPSGAGKSTLMRMLLGFERPEKGTVLFDGQDLGQVDVQAVRRQIGTVLQDGKLMVGDLYHNIVGNTLLSLDEAWEAARLAGIEEDIKALPMGMHTILMEEAATFSGGQRQRLMLARAIVGRPRYLFLDEATSALDAMVQRQVVENLQKLRATRVVIAHRLSTIRGADRIYVLMDGRVRQVGTYEELIGQEGPFADLARRQLA